MAKDDAQGKRQDEEVEQPDRDERQRSSSQDGGQDAGGEGSDQQSEGGSQSGSEGQDQSESGDQSQGSDQGTSEDQEQGKSGGGKQKGGKSEQPPKGIDLINHARAVFTQATGRVPEAVTGLRKEGDGWQVSLDVVELRRIPSSTDVMAEYLVQLSGDGDFLGYERMSRFIRSQSSSGEQG